MKHQVGSLEQLQSLDLESKIMLTKARIKQWYEHYEGNVYVSFSGGKDSTVLLDIVRSIYPEVEACFVDTGLEFPEIRDFVRQIDNVTWLKPKMNFKQVVNVYGYPIISKEVSQYIYEARTTKSEKLRNKRINGKMDENGKVYSVGKIPDKYQFLLNAPFKISSKCCNIMKKSPAKNFEKVTGKKPFIGTLASESRLRKLTWIKHGCNAFESPRPTSQPLSFWTEQDILAYIYINKLNISSVYGKITEENGSFKLTGKQRTGCMFCGFGAHMYQPNQFQMLKESHPSIYKFIMKPTADGGLGMEEILRFAKINF